LPPCLPSFLQFLQNNNFAGDLLASHGLATATGGLQAAVPAFPVPAATGNLDLDLDFLAFPPTNARRYAAPAKQPAALGLAASEGNLLSSSPSFCFSDLEQRLRTEFSGDVSRFVVPASDAEGVSAAPALPVGLF
jgi:hypothetical protein